jgi:hypothetical protein
VGAQPLDELFAGHAGPWTEQEWAALPESMGRVELLTLEKPFQVDVNLAILATATR